MPTYIEMDCIGDYADFVVYMREDGEVVVWMVPGSWLGRDRFGRKQEVFD